MERSFILKAGLRGEIRDRVSRLSERERAEAAERVAELLERDIRFAGARVAACFMPLRDEVPVGRFVDGWRRDKLIVLPVVEGDRMRFFEYDPARVRTGRFEIVEPYGTAEVSPQGIDAMLVPGRAFTLAGLRLGRGGGYYDRYLSQSGAEGIYRIGVAFGCQVVDELPVTADDVVMDRVIAG